MSLDRKTIKGRKHLYRKRYIKLLLSQFEERKAILEQELAATDRKIKELWDKFKGLKRGSE